MVANFQKKMSDMRLSCRRHHLALATIEEARNQMTTTRQTHIGHLFRQKLRIKPLIDYSEQAFSDNVRNEPQRQIDADQQKLDCCSFQRFL